MSVFFRARPSGVRVFAVLALLILASCGSEEHKRGGPLSPSPPDPSMIDSVEAIQAALWLSPDLTASQELAATIGSDLANIRFQFKNRLPIVASSFVPPWIPSEIAIEMTEDARQRYEAGTWSEFDALNAEFGLKRIKYNFGNFFTLEFESLLNPCYLAWWYRGLDGIQFCGANFTGGCFGGDVVKNVWPTSIPGGMGYLFRSRACDRTGTDWYFRVKQNSVYYLGYCRNNCSTPPPSWADEALKALEENPACLYQ